MNETSNIVPLRQPDEIDDPLTNILRAGARQLLAQAVEAEVETFLLATVKDLKLARRARPCRAAWLRPDANASDRHRPCRCRAGEDSRPRGGRRWRADPVQLGDLAAVGTADQKSGCAVAGSVPARHLDRRFPGGADGLAGQGRAEPVARGDFPADGRVARRTNAGRGAICRRGDTCTSGPMASSCRPAWKTTANACWC